MIYLALYHGHRDGWGLRSLLARFTDGLTRVLTKGRYSHCEIAVVEEEIQYPVHTVTVDDQPAPLIGTCYSASLRDGGVRRKTMLLPRTKWDLIPVTDDAQLEARLQQLWEKTQGQPYDLSGSLGVVFKTTQHERKWFCSEWCGRVLGLSESWRFSPNDLAAIYSKEEK